MIQISTDHQKFIDAQVASGAFREPNEVVQEALDLLRGAIDANMFSSIVDIREGMADEQAGRTRTLADVAVSVNAALRERQ